MAIQGTFNNLFEFLPTLFQIWENSLPALNLRAVFEDLAFIPVDIRKDCGFDSYLEPNEGSPQRIKPHLALAERGVSVVTGTERGYFHLLFSDEKKCQGLIFMDINPKAVFYTRFNTCLLELSKDRNEYVKLSERPKDEASFAERIETVAAKIGESDLPEKIKKFYLEHILDCTSVYYGKIQCWRDDDYYKQCRYDLDDAHFSKLQKYAKSGNIISILGDINDLRFIGVRNVFVSVLDTSNICDYACINPQGTGNFRPRVVWTTQSPRVTDYFSYVHKTLNDQERIEFDELVKTIKQANQIDDDLHNWLNNKLPSNSWLNNELLSNSHSDRFNADIGAFHSRNTLKGLREYVAENILEVPRLGYIDMKMSYRGFERLNSFSPEEIDCLCKHEGARRFLESLVDNWVILDPKIYLAFSRIEGWKEEFEKKFSCRCQNLDGFLGRLEEQGLLEGFIQEFGQGRLDALKEKDRLANLRK
jgi:hypothetical protein